MHSLIQKQDVKVIVWVQTAFLGDIIISTAAFMFVKHYLPDVRQILITTNIGKSALKNHPALDDVIAFDKSSGYHGMKVVKQKIQDMELPKKHTLCLQLHKSFRSSLLSKLLGFQTITYFQSSMSFLAHTRVDRVAVMHEAYRCMLLLEPLGFARGSMKSFKPFLPALEKSHWKALPDWLSFMESGHSIIAISPGSTWGTKRWPIENFVDLVKRALLREDVKIVLIGGGDEKELGDLIERSIERSKDRFLNLIGKTSLDELRAVYPLLSVLVTNDSSPIHYASAFDVQTIAIFGATVSGLGFTPLASGSIVIELEGLSCRPCSDHGPQVCPLGHFRCMREIETEQVYSHLNDFLNVNTFDNEI